MKELCQIDYDRAEEVARFQLRRHFGTKFVSDKMETWLTEVRTRIGSTDPQQKITPSRPLTAMRTQDRSDTRDLGDGENWTLINRGTKRTLAISPPIPT